jgi:hypothetical protein
MAAMRIVTIVAMPIGAAMGRATPVAERSK